jgi:copper(I)-binding protein
VASFALGIATLGLAACDDAAEHAAPAETGIPGVTIGNPRMVLAAVPGNPAAVYFDLAYDNDRSLALNRVSVEGAKSAEFHDYGMWDSKMQMQPMLPLPLKKGDKVEFKPGGKHVMVMGVPATMKPGGTAKVTIVVSGGGKQTFDAPIKAAGDDR